VGRQLQRQHLVHRLLDLYAAPESSQGNWQIQISISSNRRQSIDAHKPVEATAIKPNEANNTAIGFFLPTEPVA
jgi:hypothetical protein